MTTKQAATRPETRWLLTRDFSEVLAIEAETCPVPWGEVELRGAMREPNTIGMVAVRGQRVVGYMVYRLGKTGLVVLKLAVASDSLLTGVGRTLIQKLVGKLMPGRRRWIAVECRERSVRAQNFLKAMGFVAVKVTREGYADSGEDSYRFIYEIREGR